MVLAQDTDFITRRNHQQSRYQAKCYDADFQATGGGTRQNHYHRPPRYQHGQPV